jgi:hypothetical protein
MRATLEWQPPPPNLPLRGGGAPHRLTSFEQNSIGPSPFQGEVRWGFKPLASHSEFTGGL